MTYGGIPICGAKISRNRVCFGRPGHSGAHGHNGNLGEVALPHPEIAK